jgi:heme-degrading monooxygenase HmoA
MNAPTAWQANVTSAIKFGFSLLTTVDTKEEDMIARTWHGKTTTEKAGDYQRHFTTRVAPHLKELAGHLGAYLLRREENGEVEFLALTLWDSIESVRAFAGQNPDVAIVEPEGRAALSSFDDRVRHYDIAYDGA